MVDGDPPPRPCDVCDRPAKHLDYTAQGAVHIEDVRACQVHHDLASAYKPVGGQVDQDKKREWLAKVTKDKDRAESAADKLMRPDRDGEFRSRQLTNREKYGQQREGIDRTVRPPGYSL